MLDFRHETFLSLCKIGNYTKTAEFLHITQPAVSQHIKFLEEYYGGKLFCYEGKLLVRTPRGKLLEHFATTMRADSQHLHLLLSKEHMVQQPFAFGATLTIGEYHMPPILMELMKKDPGLPITMAVDNTTILLQKLQNGALDFALLEGFFEKSAYSSKIFSRESFVPVCAPDSHLANRRIVFDEILQETLILREKGSGTRDIFEQILLEHKYSLNSFQTICEIGNMSVIKQLVAQNLGITFLYQAAIKQELENKTLCVMDIEDFSAWREFNFVYLQNSIHEQEYLHWYDTMVRACNHL